MANFFKKNNELFEYLHTECSINHWWMQAPYSIKQKTIPKYYRLNSEPQIIWVLRLKYSIHFKITEELFNTLPHLLKGNGILDTFFIIDC